VAIMPIRRGPDELVLPGQKFLATPSEAEQLLAFGRAELTPQAAAIIGDGSRWISPHVR
jgi:hypothetical protein